MLGLQPDGERPDRLAQPVEVGEGQGSQVRVAAVQQHPSQRPGQVLPGPGRGVAELDQPVDVPAEQRDVDAQGLRRGRRAR